MLAKGYGMSVGGDKWLKKTVMVVTSGATTHGRPV